MKIKEVCTRTGLTEKSIRLYIEQKLIHPKCVLVNGRKQITFTEENILELEKIRILREADFSISEIREMLRNPTCIAEFIEKKKVDNQKNLAYYEKLDVLLQRLGPSDLGSLEAISETLKPIQDIRENESRISIRFKNSLIILLILLLVSICGYAKLGIVFLLMFWGSGLGIAGVVGLYMSIRYLLCCKHAEKMQHKSIGTIIHICEEHRIDEEFVRGGKTQSTFSAAGIGGIGTVLLMIWNEIRFDCYFPVIQYENEDRDTVSATYPYGAFQKSFSLSEKVEVAWNLENPHKVYPIKAKWLVKKGFIYLMLSSILLIFCGCLFMFLLKYIYI